MDLLTTEDGQDMVEYSLLMAAITLACAALLFGVGENVSAIWSIVNSRLSDAASGT
jgi:Flp pilus assembly pilin Flp